MVRYQNCCLQISRDNRSLPRPRDKVIVRALLDGSVQVVYAGQVLRHREIPADQVSKGTEPDKTILESAPLSVAKTPAPTHPWYRSKLFPNGRAIGATRL